MVNQQVFNVKVLSEDTKKFYFKDGNSGMNIEEAMLGFYKTAVDKAEDDTILCFFSTAINKHGEQYYTEKHYVVKYVIKPFLEVENHSRYCVRIKWLKKYDMKKIFKELENI